MWSEAWRPKSEALHIASKAGPEQIVIALLQHGSDINITSMSKNNDFKHEYGSAPLHVAAQEGRLEVLALILKMKVVEHHFTLLLMQVI